MALDYCFSTSASTPVLCLKRSQTVVIVAHPVMSMEAMSKLVRLMAKEIENMGHALVAIKCDNALAMATLAGRVKDVRSHPTVIEESPGYEPSTNGLRWWGDCSGPHRVPWTTGWVVRYRMTIRP